MATIHRRKLYNAGTPQMVGAPVVVYQTPYMYVDRNVTPDLISDAYKTPIIFSSLSYLNRLCFGGLDFKLESMDGKDDDTKQGQIDKALPQIKKIDSSLARIGRMKNCTTLDCVRMAGLESWSWRKCLFEKAVSLGEGNIYSLKLQSLPGNSFNRTPAAFSGNNRYQPDDILKGILFDTTDAELHFYQNVDSIREPIEIPADQVLYIEDLGVPHNTSLLHSIISTIEFMKQARHDFRLALKRVGIPKEVASVDGRELAALAAANINITGGYQTLVDYANNLVANQSSNQAEVALPGIRLSYPSIPIAINPMEVEKFIEQIILNHFFGKAITEQLAQAISVSSTPGKQLLDTVISGHQEVAGKPFEQLWSEWLEMNGYDLVMKFDYWSWAPADQKAEEDRASSVFANGASLVNDYRASMGEDPYTPEQLKQLFEEQNALKRGKISGEEGALVQREQEPKAATIPISNIEKLKNSYPDDRLDLEDDQAAKLSETFLESVRKTVDKTAWGTISLLVASEAPVSDILAAIRFAEYLPAPSLEVSYRITMNLTSKYIKNELGIEARFDLVSMNPEAMSWLNEFGASEVKYISQSQREAIGSILSQGYKEGWSYSNQGNYIKQFIGLDANRARTLHNYGNSLMEQEISESEAWKLIAQRGQELLKERADMIALNETLQASQHGWADTVSQMVEQGVLDPDEYVGVWTATVDERTCEECMAANGSIRILPDGVYEATGTKFTYLHPGDRCVETIENAPSSKKKAKK